MEPDAWAAGAKASATALHNRTTQIRKPGVYIRFLEWIIWGLANKMTVQMLFGDAIQDIIDMFAPSRYQATCGWAGLKHSLQLFDAPLGARCRPPPVCIRR